jgi:hypothetical protein
MKLVMMSLDEQVRSRSQLLSVLDVMAFKFGQWIAWLE